MRRRGALSGAVLGSRVEVVKLWCLLPVARTGFINSTFDCPLAKQSAQAHPCLQPLAAFSFRAVFAPYWVMGEDVQVTDEHQDAIERVYRDEPTPLLAWSSSDQAHSDHHRCHPDDDGP